MKTYGVNVSGMVETTEWYKVQAEDESEAEEKALSLAEEAGLDDPQVSGRIKVIEKP